MSNEENYVRQQLVKVLVLFAMVLASSQLSATENAAKQEGPHEVVRDVTGKLMSLARDKTTSYKDHPDKYFKEVRVALEPVVSFGFIAKNVMASYWQAANEQQRERFADTFTVSMVETLGKGLANFSELEVTTLPPEGDISNQKKVEVKQEVQAADGTSKVSYTMVHAKSGDWKLINVVLNGVNLGKSFRDQFVQAMKQNDNNIDKVIDNWAKQG